MPRTILISELQGVTDEIHFDNARPYLPYMWSILKTYYEHHGRAVGDYEWLEPLWASAPVDDILGKLEGVTIDVLGLSCYTWNWALQCGLAERLKARHPDCVVIAGGPEPDYKNSAFFVEHPYIDAIVVKDGEIPFTCMLDAVADGRPLADQTPGVYLPDPETNRPSLTSPAQLPVEFPESPYSEQQAYYTSLLEHFPPGHFDAILETNRGCPYGCSYCDWGSNTLSKVRRFNEDRVHKDIEMLARYRVDGVMLADANFGILPRDVAIAEYLAEIRRAHDAPAFIYWSAAKNNPERVMAISKIFSDSGLSTSHALSIQHTRPEVLSATARSNISTRKQLQVVRAMMDYAVPIEVQLILGIPGDTPNLWRGCLTDLMEWGVHEDYLIQAYRLLPNAPAADRAFRDQWQPRTVSRQTYDYLVRPLATPAMTNIPQKPEHIVISSTSYDVNDWIAMATDSALIKGLHNGALTQTVAVYLRLTHGVTYGDFYWSLIEDLGGQSQTVLGRAYRAIRDHYTAYVQRGDASDHMPLTHHTLEYAVHPSRWLYVALCDELETFYEELRAYLTECYPSAPLLKDLVGYQRDIVILPTYDRSHGKPVTSEHDWPTYFRDAKGKPGDHSLPEPSALPKGVRLHACDQRTSERASAEHFDNGLGEYYGGPLDWEDRTPQDRFERWMELIVLGRSSFSLHCHQRLQEIPSSWSVYEPPERHAASDGIGMLSTSRPPEGSA